MSQHVRTAIREAVKFGLNTIIKGNTISPSSGTYTYNNTIRNIGDPPKSPNEFKNFPAVNIYLGDENNTKAAITSNAFTFGNENLLYNSFVLHLDFFIKSNTVALAQENILADVQAYFGTYWNIPDSGGTATAFNSIYKSSEVFGIKGKSPTCGISIDFNVNYRQFAQSPQTLR